MRPSLATLPLTRALALTVPRALTLTIPRGLPPRLTRALPLRLTRALPLTLTLTVVATGCQPATLTEVQEDVFTQSCAFSSCHGTGREGELGLSDAATAYADLVNVPSFEEPGAVRVVPGDPDASLLLQVLQGPVGEVRQMPVNGQASDKQIALVRSWIEAGAEQD